MDADEADTSLGTLIKQWVRLLMDGQSKWYIDSIGQSKNGV